MQSKPVKTALCSFGMSGRIFHAPFLAANPGFEVSAVLERTKNESRKAFPHAIIYRSIDDLIADEEIELVIVNTPNVTHFNFAEMALMAGKHVVVEKPFTVTVAEGLRLKELAAEKNCILSVYQNRRYDSDFKTIRKVLASGALGKIAEVEMRFDRYRLEPGAKAHKENPGRGTGNLYDLGSHLIDQAIQLFGMPDRLFADIAILRESSRVDDYFELVLFYENLRIRMHSTYLAMHELPGYVLFGTHGSFVKPKTNVQEERLSAGELPTADDWGVEPRHEAGILTTLANGKPKESIIKSETGNYMTYFDGIHAAIRHQQPVPVSADDAIRVIHIIELAYQSSESGKVLTVNDLFKSASD